MNFAIMQSDETIFEIHCVGDRILRKNAKNVTIFDENLEKFVRNMVVTMYAAAGIGLAAPQVGESVKVVVVDVTSGLDGGEVCTFDGKEILNIATIMPLCLINPVIKTRSTQVCSQNEGCLSIPDFHGYVRRPRAVSLSFVDQYGGEHALACDGILARCVQHEIDHLAGKLYTDLLRPRDKKRFAKYLAERAETPSTKCNHGDGGAADDL
ncbi:MAG: peptide deformylase [Puniceicoccales bacterium]|jgi:peptide deformylase|nr:peptide deformylase [Puniceicoccales bacterium]